MLISGGKVIAIDKVSHDRTLTGDGRFIPLGISGEWIGLTGYVDTEGLNGNKVSGTMDYSTTLKGAMLEENTVYHVTTNLCLTVKEATPYNYDATLMVGNDIFSPHPLTFNGMNEGNQNYSFTQVAAVSAKSPLTVVLKGTDTSALKSAKITQIIHRIDLLSGYSPTPPHDTIPIGLNIPEIGNIDMNIEITDDLSEGHIDIDMADGGCYHVLTASEPSDKTIPLYLGGEPYYFVSGNGGN
jgi:hypothetical protein